MIERYARLSHRFTQEIIDSRPALLSEKVGESLIEYMQFRHVARHIYAFNLDAMRLEVLVWGLPNLWGQLRLELNAFGEFLTELGRGEM